MAKFSIYKRMIINLICVFYNYSRDKTSKYFDHANCENLYLDSISKYQDCMACFHYFYAIKNIETILIIIDLY